MAGKCLSMIEELGFEGSTYGLEDQLLDFISEATNSFVALLQEDYLDEEEMPDEAKVFNRELAKFPNIALLMSLWPIYCPHKEYVTATIFWDATDINIETNFMTKGKEKSRKSNELRIHYLFQLKEIYYDEHDIRDDHVFDKWKICYLRTGLRDEYQDNEGMGLIAAQLLIASDALETSLVNISAEIIWLRLGERESVLNGISKDEAETLATAHFQNI